MDIKANEDFCGGTLTIENISFANLDNQDVPIQESSAYVNLTDPSVSVLTIGNAIEISVTRNKLSIIGLDSGTRIHVCQTSGHVVFDAESDGDNMRCRGVLFENLKINIKIFSKILILTIFVISLRLKVVPCRDSCTSII